MDEDALQLWHHYLGRSTVAASPTVVTYDAGYVVLSFFTSLIGCLTTIELLQRRTSMRGAYNWFLLVASAITMGGIGIWAMHFVGNRAIVLDRGHPQRQILYNKGFTAASFFLPIIVLLFAFYTLGTSAKARQLQVAAAGVLTGAAVCGMHYMGQLGIANYNCSYRPQNVVGAAIISVVASLISLSLFFRMRDKWTDVWWKRTLCAVVLAIAVSGMHWTAAIGTIYHWRGDLSVHGDSRTTTSVATSCLSMGSCIMLLVVIGIRGRKRRNARITSQRLVLACSYFDDKGNLMVTQDGLLPNTKITNQYIERTFGEDELSRSHDTFHWIFRASHQWTIFKDLIAGMKKDIEGDPTTKQYRPGSHTTTLPDDTSEISVNFARVFKELFCVAAQQLANTLHEPLEKIGVLFEEPMDTGTVCCSPSTPTGMRKSSIFSSSTAVDVERGKGINSFTKGKYLFLVREIQRGEMAKFAALGYRFAAVEQIADPLAKSMQVNRADLVERMKRIRTSAARTCLPPPGVYLSCFMLRPSMYKSFDILVLDKQSKQLQSLDEMQVSEVLKVLVNKSSKPNNVDIDEGFRWQLYNAFLKLVDAVGDYDSMMAAKFSARQFQVSCQHGGGCGSSGSCTTCKFYSIRALRNIHASPTRSDLTYVPLSFFSIQQQVHTGHPDDNGFARKVERQFGHLHRDAALSMGTSVARGRSPSPAESNSQGADSPRIPIFRNPLRRSVVRRRSDEATIVDHETAVPDATDTEMTRVRSLDEDYPAGEAGESESERKPCWVSELFSLFQTKCEPGWGSARPGGWKWDISVQNSVEIATKDRRKGSNVVCASF
ncbi:hypothetical protein, variant 1 [Exophiala xenobiotica]|uniref:MHYT domain-containing protein n=1 Tax=Exophiala xenobiotica TaxID=348802 RepID=A0A0D2FJE0_9EURO|nr:hypothetical protein, variant 1 [Exophiala xenobiotica]KIW60259.1 hypothetical protein, variant 1 [Exophiala xenobiotica]